MKRKNKKHDNKIIERITVKFKKKSPHRNHLCSAALVHPHICVITFICIVMGEKSNHYRIAKYYRHGCYTSARMYRSSCTQNHGIL